VRRRARRDVLSVVRLALQSIFKSKMRTFLTMLGIIIGVGAVTVIVAWATA
jgi:hypothetical protein